ncbi:response regulator [candidate division FCPU426 bacterium]|nr:response regulator [candidate division FCPU426 bacterium]
MTPNTFPYDNPALRKAKSSKQILIVDDEKDIVNMIAYKLQAEGYRVFTAYDGLDALEKVAEIKPDLIILDIMMPKVDGWVVCHTVKGNLATKNTRVIILTAKAQFMAKIKGLYILQADVYMSKPFDLGELSENIVKLLCLEEETHFITRSPGTLPN